MSEKYLKFKEWLATPKMENRRHRYIREGQSLVMSLFRALIIIGISYIIISPIIGIISTSFKSISDIYNPLVYLIPETLNTENYQFAFQYMNYISSFIATLGFTVFITVLQIIITSMVGYGFARFNFPFKSIFFGLVIATIVLPVQAYMIPMFMQFRLFNVFGLNLNLINTYAPVTIMTLTGMGIRSGLYIFIFRQFFRGLPAEIEEAALIDGAGQFRTYLTVMLPNAASAIITVAMFSFVWQYNDTYFTGIFMYGMRFLSSMLTGLGNTYSSQQTVTDPNQINLIVNAGIVLMIIPIISVYMLLQKYFMEGMERSGIVG